MSVCQSNSVVAVVKLSHANSMARYYLYLPTQYTLHTHILSPPRRSSSSGVMSCAGNQLYPMELIIWQWLPRERGCQLPVRGNKKQATNMRAPKSGLLAREWFNYRQKQYSTLLRNITSESWAFVRVYKFHYIQSSYTHTLCGGVSIRNINSVNLIIRHSAVITTASVNSIQSYVTFPVTTADQV